MIEEVEEGRVKAGSVGVLCSNALDIVQRQWRVNAVQTQETDREAIRVSPLRGAKLADHYIRDWKAQPRIIAESDSLSCRITFHSMFQVIVMQTMKSFHKTVESMAPGVVQQRTG